MTAPRIPHSPDEPMRCAALACTMRGRICVERQRATYSVVGGSLRRGERVRYERPDVRFPLCVSGNCAQGAVVMLAIGDAVPARTHGARGFAPMVRR